VKASFVDLRKKSSQILRALERNEKVTVLYRGRPKAILQPIAGQVGQPAVRAKDHPAFGLWKDRDDLKDVAAHMRRLRRGRFDAR
jgi:antitoxin (DNA-binding transcriptional repressor) of toxin-antitoxin stability system